MRTEPTWSDGPPPAAPYYRIITAPRHGFKEVLVLSDGIVGAQLHWIEGRSHPCTAGSGKCYCTAPGNPVPSRWRGYVAGLVGRPSQEIVLVELTAKAIRDAASVSAAVATWRGQIMRIWRTGASPRAAVCCSLRIPDAPVVAPACPDVHQALMRIWGG